MTDFVGMSWDTFRVNTPLLGALANAALDNDELRGRLRMLAVYEGGTGQIIAEVIRTPHGPLVLTRAPIDDDPDHAHIQGGPRGLEPLTDDPDQRFEATTRRGRYRFSADDFVYCIESRRRKIEHVKPGLFVLDRPRPPRPAAEVERHTQAVADYRQRSAARKRLG